MELHIAMSMTHLGCQCISMSDLLLSSLCMHHILGGFHLFDVACQRIEANVEVAVVKLVANILKIAFLDNAAHMSYMSENE